MAEFRTGLLRPVDEADYQVKLQKLLGEDQPEEEFEPVLDPETGEVLYYKPTGRRAVPEAVPGTPLEKEEIPIPYVSLPDVVKPEVKPEPKYSVTPPEVVPEAPAEQLEKLLPPVDKNAELEALNLPPVDVYEKVAERVRRRAPVRPPEEPPPEPPSDRGFVEYVTAPERLGAAKFLEHPSNLVYGIPAALAELLAGIEEATPAEYVDPRTGEKITGTKSGTARTIADWLKEAQAASKRGVAKVTGTEGQKPVTPIEKLGSFFGEYAQPVKGVSAAATVGLAAAGAAARGGLTTFGPEDVPIVGTAQAASDYEKLLGVPQGQTPQKGATPPAKQPPVKAAPAPNAPVVPATMPPGSITVAPTEDLKKRLPPGAVVPNKMEIPPPDMRTTAKPTNLKRRQRKGVFTETEEQYEKRVEDAWIVKEAKARIYTPTANEIFQSVGGMQKTSTTEYAAMGALGATLVGMALAPLITRRFVKGEVPAPRPVAAAAPGTAAISTPKDLARAQDDINASLIAIGRRAGMDPTILNRLSQTFRIQTRNGARALADSAISIGRMETPSFRFRAPVALDDIARMSTPQSDQYLKLLDTFEKLQVLRTAPKGTFGKTVKTVTYQAEPTVNGMTLDAARQAIKDVEAANPGIDKIAQANQGWNKAIREFQHQGEYSTLSKEEFDRLSMSHTNSLAGKFEGDAIKGQADAARTLIKQRLDNEAVGKYVDEMRKLDEGYFVKVTKEQLDANPRWKDNVVSFKRNGEREYYTTDPLIADVLKTDHHTITGYGSNALFATKRLLETTTTGTLAPFFAPVSAIRSYWIAKFTTEQGFRAPTAVGSVLAIPQQLLPQIAKSVSRGLDNGGLGAFLDALGAPPAVKEGLSRRLAVAFEESVYAQLKAAGSHRGSILEQQQRAKGLERAAEAINAAAATNPALRGAQHFWNAWRASIESIHNGPAFNFVKRNMGREGMPELALRARRLTGDPRAGGEFYTGHGTARRPIRFESDNTIDQAVADTLVKGYGYSTEAARQAIPWWNPTLQGIKRVGEAYLHDPIRFTRSTALYAMMPAAGLFYYAKSLGNDPNGRSYLDYLLTGRSAYNRQMNFYFPIPGRPAEDGIEITFFHELNPFKRAMEIALHHMLGSDVPDEGLYGFLHSGAENVTKKRSLKEDLWVAAHAFLDTAVTPPVPPLVGAAGAYFGFRVPQGVFGGEAYQVKRDPFNQNGGMPAALEGMSRALIGGVGEALAGFYAAASNSEGGWINAVNNGAKQARDAWVKRTPFLREATGIRPDISNNTDMAKEVFDNQKAFNDLARFFKKWTIAEGKINVKPSSIGGGPAVQEQYKLDWLNPANPGLHQPVPTNPLYIEFMQQFYNRFMKESPNFVKGEDGGGIAFKSLWANYGDATQKVERLKDVNYGTYDRWQREMEPEARDELEKNGVDTTDRRQVVNFYKKKQADALRVINYVRIAVEDQMSKRASEVAGKPTRITLKDILPYLPPPPPGEAPFMFETLVP